MNCPLQTRESAEQWLDYCAGKLDPQTAAVLERHIAICPECRQFAERQGAVWEALDAWEQAPVSAGFDRRLYQRIEEEGGWWQRLMLPLRPLTQHWNVAASLAGLFVVLMAGVLLNRPATAPQVAKDTVQLEQVEHALDAMDMLAEFNRDVKDVSNRKM
jgi:anti-sigma factor RsiW